MIEKTDTIAEALHKMEQRVMILESAITEALKAKVDIRANDACVIDSTSNAVMDSARQILEAALSGAKVDTSISADTVVNLVMDDCRLMADELAVQRKQFSGPHQKGKYLGRALLAVKILDFLKEDDKAKKARELSNIILRMKSGKEEASEE